jgi:hypothetical protein
MTQLRTVSFNSIPEAIICCEDLARQLSISAEV